MATDNRDFVLGNDRTHPGRRGNPSRRIDGATCAQRNTGVAHPGFLDCVRYDILFGAKVDSGRVELFGYLPYLSPGGSDISDPRFRRRLARLEHQYGFLSGSPFSLLARPRLRLAI